MSKSLKENKIAETPLKAGLPVKAIVIAFALICLASCVVLTSAWYETSREPRGSGSGVASSNSEASLFIQSASVSGLAYTTRVDSITAEARLFPISLQAQQDTRESDFQWWYASQWQGLAVTGYKTAGDITASGTNAYVYTNRAKEPAVSRVAYIKEDYSVYTNQGSLDVYFDPASQVTITHTGDNARELEKAIRVGFAVGGKLKYVYVPPKTEGRTSNSVGASGSGPYMVTGADSVSDSIIYPTRLNSFTAAGDATGGYTAGDASVSLLQAGTEPTTLSVYVWLEGTDEDALVGFADNASGVKVSFHLVGVKAVEPESEPAEG